MLLSILVREGSFYTVEQLLQRVISDQRAKKKVTMSASYRRAICINSSQSRLSDPGTERMHTGGSLESYTMPISGHDVASVHITHAAVAYAS